MLFFEWIIDKNTYLSRNPMLVSTLWIETFTNYHRFRNVNLSEAWRLIKNEQCSNHTLLQLVQYNRNDELRKICQLLLQSFEFLPKFLRLGSHLPIWNLGSNHGTRCPTHSVHWGINPYHPLSCQALSLNLQTVQAPLLRESPLYISFSWTPLPPLKIGFFREPQSFSSFIPCYLLKVTKFLVKFPSLNS